MIEPGLYTVVREFGLGIVLALAMTTLLFVIIKWTLATTKDILNQAAKERECWHKAISEHTEQAKVFHDSVQEAHKYQREEHKEMIGQLKEITITLGRINGYKKD